MASEWRRIIREAERQGWTVERGKRGQWKLIPPDPTKRISYIHQTPSDRRALDNMIAELRRSGLEWPPPDRKKRGDT